MFLAAAGFVFYGSLVERGELASALARSTGADESRDPMLVLSLIAAGMLAFSLMLFYKAKRVHAGNSGEDGRRAPASP